LYFLTYIIIYQPWYIVFRLLHILIALTAVLCITLLVLNA